MDMSEDVDRERRRVKKKRSTWARALVRPQTIKTAIAVGRVIAEVLTAAYNIVKLFWP